MDNRLLELPAYTLLKKFGAGEHKPGSGSAAALQGMLSAQLILTVISLTTEPKRRTIYQDFFDETTKAATEINDRIYPQLYALFHEDSALFDKAIKMRVARDEEKDPANKAKLADDALAALIPATELPIDIAELCAELADIGALMFASGFKSARGDSGVAMAGAIAAMDGCLSIIDLNLLSFTPSEWSKDIMAKAEALRVKLRNLSAKSIELSNGLSAELAKKVAFHTYLATLRNKKLAVSDSEIEDLTIDLQRFLWKYRELIWKKDNPNNPLDLLIPETVIKLVGYTFNRQVTLGQHRVGGSQIEVAGLIDNREKEISISGQFLPEVQNFTAAHELGHALMHEQTVLHRDKPLDGSLKAPPKDTTEYQADKFATFFLMPKKQIIRVFKSIFRTGNFEINEATAFALTSGSEEKLLKEVTSLRLLSRKLAAAEYYNGVRFTSLTERFNVSTGAMAIRLEELELVIF